MKKFRYILGLVSLVVLTSLISILNAYMFSLVFDIVTIETKWLRMLLCFIEGGLFGYFFLGPVMFSGFLKLVNRFVNQEDLFDRKTS